MVQADKRTVHAIIETVKKLPVSCKTFQDADMWVGVVLELQKIAEDEIVPVPAAPVEEPQQVEIKYAPPDNIITDESEVVKDGR